MGQLFLWVNRVEDFQVEAFKERFGFEVPRRLLDLYESLPTELIEYMGYFSLDEIVEETHRHQEMLPGLIPFAQEKSGDLFCFYPPWQAANGDVPCGVWMKETCHFLPLAGSFTTFVYWWFKKEMINNAADEDYDETLKMLDLMQSAVGLDDLGHEILPPDSSLGWHQDMAQIDPENVYSLCFLAIYQSGVIGLQRTLEDLRQARLLQPRFGASHFWEARFLAMQGRIHEAHQAYWRHLQCPQFINGFHSWYHLGDLMIPEASEREALTFLLNADIPAPEEIRHHPRTELLTSSDPHNYRTRLELASIFMARGEPAQAILELENAYFLESWNTEAAQEILPKMVEVYDILNLRHRRESAKRIIHVIRLQQGSLGRD